MPLLSEFRNTPPKQKNSIHSPANNAYVKNQINKTISTKTKRSQTKEIALAKAFQKKKKPIKKYSFNSGEIPLSIAVKTILKGTHHNIVWDRNVDKNRLTTLNFHNIKRSEALQLTVNSSGYGVQYNNNTILISPTLFKVYRLPPLAGVMDINRLIGGDSASSTSSSNSGTSGSSGSSGTSGSSSTGANKTIQQTNKYDFYASLKENLNSLKSEAGIVTIIPETQMITVSDDFDHSRLIHQYIDNIWNIFSYEAFLDIHILEVSLNKAHSSGIKWDVTGNLVNNAAGTNIALTTSGQFLPALAPVASAGLTISNAAGSALDILLQQLESFGSVKTLYQPKAHVYNGRPIKIDNTSIDDIADSQTTIDTGVGSATSTVSTTAIVTGLQFDLTPFIYNKETMLVEIAPKLSQNNGSEIITLGGGSQVQLKHLSSRELLLTSTLKNTQTQVFGGLIFSRKSKQKKEPFLSKIPFIGNAFKFKEQAEERSELVITITPYIRKMDDLGNFEISRLEAIDS